MFELIANDLFFKKKLISLLNFKQNIFICDDQSSTFASIKFEFNNAKILISLEKNSVLLKTPCRFEVLSKAVRGLLSNLTLTYNHMIYSPIHQTCEYQKNSSNLNNIHNIILANLLLNLTMGINKADLYKKIWPIDKDIQINKLDTHLTNLKNKLRNEINFDVKFSSNRGKISLILN